VTGFERARRQFAAPGGGDGGAGHGVRSPAVPSGTRALAYVALLAVGGLLAARTFEPAVGRPTSLIRIVATLDPGAVVLAGVLVTAVPFVSFEAAACAADGLLVGGFRTVLTN
jgi:hypothetical protein